MAFTIYYQNVRGLRTKTDIFFKNIVCSDYDIIGITESWLNDNINSGELFDSRYDVFIRNRNYADTGQSRGGGTLLAVKRYINATVNDWKLTDEDIWITIRVPSEQGGMDNVHICSVYIPRNLRFHSQLLNFSTQLNQKMLSLPADKFIILGDFNLPEIKWTLNDHNSYLIPEEYQSTISSQFIDYLSFSGLQQFNSFTNANERILDLILSNIHLKVLLPELPLVPEDIHHKALHVDLPFNILSTLVHNKTQKYIFAKGNYDEINTHLSNIDWPTKLNNTNIDIAIETFYNELNIVINQFIPRKFIQVLKYPPWYSPALIKITREKRKYLSKFKKYNNPSDYEAFSILRIRQKNMSKECHQNFVLNAERNIHRNPKSLFSYIKSKRTTSSIPSTMYYQNEIAHTGQEISQLFSSFFYSVYEKCDVPNLNSHADHSVAEISDLEISYDLILKYINQIDSNKGAGPDGIPPIFISKCSKNLAYPLLILFKRSLQTGKFPSMWKQAFVTPIYKSGPRNLVQNYRPISKLSIFSKLFEKLAADQISNALKNTLSEHQHGFRSGKSVTTNLACFTNFILHNMDKRIQTDAIYTDYSKAFDKVNHSILFSKLKLAGIHGDLLRWLDSYIRNRSQAVVLSGFKSNWVNITSGVPQGSILGPLLFNIYINDITSCFKHCKAILYADDMKLYLPIDDIACCLKIQEDLNNLSEYCKINCLFLNIDKCYSISFTRNRTKIIFKYSINNVDIKRKESVRDLGVTLDSKLTFELHINNIVTKATQMLGFILRTSKLLYYLDTFILLYYTYVRPHLEHASQIWNPRYITYVHRIERVQEKFLSYINFRSFYAFQSNEDIRQFFKIPKLNCRRIISDQLLLYRILNNKISCPYLLQKIDIRVPGRNGRNVSLFYNSRSNTNYLQNEFIHRACHYHNTHLTYTDIFNITFNKFKATLLDKCNASQQHTT